MRNAYFSIDDFFWLDIAHWRSVAASFVGTQGAHDVYRPIFRLSVYLDALLFGQNAMGWHLDNLVIHAANSFLLAVVMRAYRLPYGACAAAAILFQFSPLSGETVDWISGRTASLCFLFMLLAFWRWTLALSASRAPWGTGGWMLLSAMTYEAGVILPGVLLCLFPIAQKWLGVSWQTGLRKLLPLLGILAVFLVVRGLFLGTFVGYTDAAGPDLWQNLFLQLDTLRRLYPGFGSVTSLWILGGALIATSFIPAFFPAGPCLALSAVILLLPYVSAAGVGERFFYMLQAPLCVVAVLPALLFPRRLRLVFLTMLLALLLPKFAVSDWDESLLWVRAGLKTKALIAAVHEAIPKNDGWANVVDGVPDIDDVRGMMGGYFETGIKDSYQESAPFVVRGQAALASPLLVKAILEQPTRFWRYDAENQQLVPFGRTDWLNAHPEAKASLLR